MYHHSPLYSYRLTRIFIFWLCITSCLITSSMGWSQSTSARNAQGDNASGDRIAVLSLRNRIQMSKEEVDYLTGLVRRIISKRLSRSYLIMTQENIEVLLPPDTNLDDCVSECQVETGRTIGARYIITGDVLRFGSSLRLTLRMHDTRSGRLIASEVAKASKLDDLEAPTERAVEGLINQIDGARLNAASTTSQPDRSPSTDTSARADRDASLDSARDRGSRPLTRRERLLRRARAAEAERKRRQDEQALKRKKRRLKKRQKRARVSQAERSSAAKTSRRTAKHIESEMSFGLAGSQCTDTGSFSLCSELESQLSFDFALDYTIIQPEEADFGWIMSLDMRYAHVNFSDTNSMINYNMNMLTLGALGGIKLWDLYLRALFGLGYSFGALTSDNSDPEGSSVELDFESTSGVVYGFDLGWQISEEWMISVYQQTLDSVEEQEVCDFFADTCDMVELPAISQQGVRLTLVF